MPLLPHAALALHAAPRVSRRQCLQRLGVGFGTLMGGGTTALPVWGHEVPEQPAWRHSVVVMGTRVDLALHGADLDRLRAATSDAEHTLQGLAWMMSRYEPHNPVAQLGTQAGQSTAVAVPPALFQVLRTGQRLAEITHGAFDITVGALQCWHFEDGAAWSPPRISPSWTGTPAAARLVPADALIRQQRQHVDFRQLHLDHQTQTARLRHPHMRLDLGGIAKLPILQAAMDVIERHGIPSAMINGGGDVLVRGGLGGRPWRVGVRDAAQPDRLIAVLSMHDGVVASSGDYERGFIAQGQRYHHIIDPATGYPTRGIHGVTLVAPHTSELNGWGSAAMVMGARRGPELLCALLPSSCQSLIMPANAPVIASPQLRPSLMPRG